MPFVAMRNKQNFLFVHFSSWFVKLLETSSGKQFFFSYVSAGENVGQSFLWQILIRKKIVMKIFSQS